MIFILDEDEDQDVPLNLDLFMEGQADALRGIHSTWLPQLRNFELVDTEYVHQIGAAAPNMDHIERIVNLLLSRDSLVLDDLIGRMRLTYETAITGTMMAVATLEE